MWGAEGGKGGDRYSNFPSNSHGALGGYAIGYTSLSNSTSLYICVGGKGENAPSNGYTSSYVPRGGTGGYNGGGKGGNAAKNAYGSSFTYLRGGGGGGGATHIAITTNRGVLKNYSSNTSEVLIVAGGGGGCSDNGYLKDNSTSYSGGGESGGSSQYAGGTQKTGYAFGQGANALDEPTYAGAGIGEGDGGGGGGWYGGYACSVSQNSNNGAGGGGSGHINTSRVSNGSMTNGLRLGNGYAIITYHPAL